uniref:Uncharacterized protein n=1 Tax=Anguilla anguilla TaxID=7936 RepID=A0A0E9WAK8_ANGAN
MRVCGIVQCRTAGVELCEVSGRTEGVWGGQVPEEENRRGEAGGFLKMYIFAVSSQVPQVFFILNVQPLKMCIYAPVCLPTLCP